MTKRDKKANPAGMFASSKRREALGRVVAITLIVVMVLFTFVTAGILLWS